MAGIGSTEYLRLLAQNGLYVALERGAPKGPRKRDRATLHYQDGREVLLRLGGFVTRPELPIETLNDYLEANLVRDAGVDGQGRTVYQLTDDGIERGRSSPLEGDHELLRDG